MDPANWSSNLVNLGAASTVRIFPRPGATLNRVKVQVTDPGAGIAFATPQVDVDLTIPQVSITLSHPAAPALGSTVQDVISAVQGQRAGNVIDLLQERRQPQRRCASVGLTSIARPRRHPEVGPISKISIVPEDQFEPAVAFDDQNRVFLVVWTDTGKATRT